MQGNAPMHPGQGPGLSLHDLGETGGSETVSLLESEIPSHSHAMRASSDAADNFVAVGNMVAKPVGRGNNLFSTTTAPLATLNDNALAPAGGDQPHNNMQPYLTLNFCIALQGVFPPRT
jgi:microcystin-dependent protein